MNIKEIKVRKNETIRRIHWIPIDENNRIELLTIKGVFPNHRWNRSKKVRPDRTGRSTGPTGNRPVYR